MISFQNNRNYSLAFTIISWALYFLMAYFVKRENTLPLFSAFAFLAILYHFSLTRTNLISQNYNHFVLAAFAFRLLFLFSIPSLSDDFYRFIWDGRLIEKGLSPYSYLPNQIIKSQMLSGANHLELFQKMNSPNYYSVYPPVLQFLFFVSAKLSFGFNVIAVFNLRIFILLAEFGTFIYLKKILDYLKLNKTKVFIYLLNPLIIVELTGNLHFEAVMLFFLTASFYYLMVCRYSISAIFIALAITTKLIPLLFLLLIIKKIGWKKGIIYATVTLLVIVLLFIPFIDKHLISNVSQSVGLYFQKFEFNASIYYLLREIGYQIVGYNTIAVIGKVLPRISMIIIMLTSISGQKNLTWESFFKRALNILFVYYIFSMTVHPWYISLLVLVSVFTETRFAIIWSILVFGSYFAYSSVPVKECLWINVIEYTVVILAFLYQNKKPKAIYAFS